MLTVERYRQAILLTEQSVPHRLFQGNTKIDYMHMHICMQVDRRVFFAFYRTYQVFFARDLLQPGSYYPMVFLDAIVRVARIASLDHMRIETCGPPGVSHAKKTLVRINTIL